MHEKTLLIQPNFSSKKWRHVEKHIRSVVNASKNAFDPLSLLENNFDWLLEENTFDWLSLLKKHFSSGSNMFFRRVVIFSKRNWAGSKVFSHASASRDYIGLLDQTLDPRVISNFRFYFDRVPFLAVAKRFSPVSELASDGAIRLVVPNRAWVRISHHPFRAMITHARPDTQNFKRDGPASSQNEKTGRPG